MTATAAYLSANRSPLKLSVVFKLPNVPLDVLRAIWTAEVLSRRIVQITMWNWKGIDDARIGLFVWGSFCELQRNW